MTAINQFVPTFEPGAVCSHALNLQEALRNAGHDSEIYAEFIRPEMTGAARPLDQHSFVDGDVSIYHMAIGSNVADYLRRSKTKIVLNHHNLTPLEYLEPWEPSVSYGVQWGFRQLRELAPRTDLAIAVSHYNEKDLLEVGYRNTAVAPILFDPNEFAHGADDQVTTELKNQKSRGETIWLFVGRISPNKAQHDILKAFAYHHEEGKRPAHLYLVGGSSSPAYEKALIEFINAEHLDKNVTLTGSVSDAARASYFRDSDVFVCLSDHEGFCVPIVEAFASGLPVVAFDSSAVGETMEGAGLLLNSKRPSIVSSAVDRIVNDSVLRDQMISAGQKRLNAFSLEAVQKQYVELIEKELL